MANVPISTITYHVFYEVLLNKFYTEDSVDIMDGLAKTSPKIWIRKRQGKFIVVELFKTTFQDPYYFSKKKSLLKMKDEEGAIKDTVLIAALKHLGYNSPKEMHSRHEMPPEEKARILLDLFEKDYAYVIALIRGNRKIRNANKLDKTIKERILYREQKEDEENKTQTDRFYQLNGEYIGTQIQGTHTPEECRLILKTKNGNNVDGEVHVSYVFDGYNRDSKRVCQVSGKFLNDNYLALLYWNSSSPILQNGVIYLKFSGDCKTLEGYFVGTYDPIPESRKKKILVTDLIKWPDQVDGILLKLQKTEKTA